MGEMPLLPNILSPVFASSRDVMEMLRGICLWSVHLGNIGKKYMPLDFLPLKYHELYSIICLLSAYCVMHNNQALH